MVGLAPELAAQTARLSSRPRSVRAPEKFIWGGGGPLEPLFHPPPPLEEGSKGWLSFVHVFHAYSMTKLRALSQSVPVTVTVSLQRGGGTTLLRRLRHYLSLE